MPTYYFYLRTAGRLETDEEGVDLPDLEAAIHEARQSAREIMAERLLSGQEVDDECFASDRFEIVTGEGKYLGSVSFQDAMKTAPARKFS